MTFRILVTAPHLEADGLALLTSAGCGVDFVTLEGGRAEMERKLAAVPYDAVISRAIPITGAVMPSATTSSTSPVPRRVASRCSPPSARMRNPWPNTASA
jgi:hypothetical protein